MAKIWSLGDSSSPEHREYLASGTLEDYRDKLDLREDQYVTPPGEWPMFNEQSGSWVEAKETYIVVELTEDDVATAEWAPGIYLLDMPESEVSHRLGLAAA